MKIIGADARLSEKRGAKILIVGPTGVGKTSLLRTLDSERTVFVDIEAGDLAVQDVQVDTVRIDDWPAARDLACRIGGPNPSFAPTACYSEAHFRAVGGALENLERYESIFIDSITAASRLSFRWSEQAPEAVAFRRGLKDVGFVEGENVAIVYRSAEGRYERLPELAADLVRRQVAVIATGGGAPATLAAKAATTTIPIVFGVGEDPVRLGLVASLARPGGNLTGINFFSGELAAKRLDLLHDLLPRAVRVAVLVNPANASLTASTLRDVEAAAHAIGLQVQVLNASTSREIMPLASV